MNCWRTVNVKKEYDPYRLMLLSLSVMVATFIFSYLIFSFRANETVLMELGMLDTLLLFLLTIPLHTMLHLLPLKFSGVRIQTRLTRKPFIALTFTKPIHRNVYIFSLIFPNLLITAGAFLLIFSFPAYMHYFLFIFSINAGLAVHDYVYFKQLITAPKHALVDRRQNGMDILVKQPV
ncbi:DUF3267 domain-containing protein [Alteribacillus sp. HJP-4]|uniref:DUF3267 domain-containing protein n=1 Tax=Alteribacillus sp. HJP-4 TaxID=2775394 RepID=UPI0035CD185E